MKIGELKALEWGNLTSTTDWIKLLSQMLSLVQDANSSTERGEIADALDKFADTSFSHDIDVITRLDDVARRTARSLRIDILAATIQSMGARTSELQAIAKEFSASSNALKKQAATLRAEKFNTAVSSLTETITSLRDLSQAVDSAKEDQLFKAIGQAVSNAQHLRNLLEATT